MFIGDKLSQGLIYTLRFILNKVLTEINIVSSVLMVITTEKYNISHKAMLLL